MCVRIAARRSRRRLRLVRTADGSSARSMVGAGMPLGRNQFVLERQEFRGGQLRDSDVALKEIKSVVFAGFVFINFDRNPESFDDFIAPVRQFLENLAIGEMRHYWWKSIPIAANWKVAQEAFFEGYHVPATHPQLEADSGRFHLRRASRAGGPIHSLERRLRRVSARGTAASTAEKDADGGQCSGTEAAMPVEAMAARLKLLADGMDAQVLQEDIDVACSLCRVSDSRRARAWVPNT